MDPLSRALLSTEAGAAQLPRIFLSTPNEHAAPLFHLLVAPDACHGPPDNVCLELCYASVARRVYSP
jgi:hypothetical protein